MDFNAQTFASLVTLVISVSVEKSPWVKDKWDKLSKDGKFLLMLALCVVAPFVPMALACLRITSGITSICPASGAIGQAIYDTLLLGLGAFLLTQGIHSGLKALQPQAEAVDSFLAPLPPAVAAQQEFVVRLDAGDAVRQVAEMIHSLPKG